MAKSLPAVWENQAWSLGWEDPLEKEMVTHSCVLAWKIPWMEEPGRLQSMGSQRVRHNWAFTFFPQLLVMISYLCAGDFLPLLYVCLYQWAFSSLIFLFQVVDSRARAVFFSIVTKLVLCCWILLAFACLYGFWYVCGIWMRVLLGRVFLVVGSSLLSL